MTDPGPPVRGGSEAARGKGLRWVCVFCGSSAGEDPRYLSAMSSLGSALVARGAGLVYGGSRLGLMGRLADTVLGDGGEVVGIIPRALTAREIAHGGLHELVITDSMHERKSQMMARADAFVAAPGGFGTLEEFFEILTWSQLGLHGKPCGLLDVAGYYGPLISLLDRSVREGFVQNAHRAMVIEDADPARLLDRMAGYTPPAVPRWIRAGET